MRRFRIALRSRRKFRIFDNARNRIILFIFVVLFVVPLLRAFIAGDFRYAFNIVFYTQKIYLIAALFVFLAYLVFRDRISLDRPDVDNAAVYAVVAIALFILLAASHTNFDTLMKMGVMDIDDDIRIGFGSILADTVDLDRIRIDEVTIKKIVELEGVPDDVTVKLHGWKEPDSRVYLSANSHDFEATRFFSAKPGWISVVLPGDVLKQGENILEFSSDSGAYISSQWVYHDAKTLRLDNSYYGQEAIIHIDEKPAVPTLFKLGFKYKLFLRLLAMIFLLLALFSMESVKLAAKELKYGLVVLGITAISAVNAVFFVQNQWKHLSLIVTKSIYFILKPFFSNIYVNLSDPVGPIIGLGDFIIRVYKNCSGIESLAIFLILFLTIICFNWKQINKPSLPFLLGLGLLGVLLVNIARLILLLLVGTYISKDIAMQFFHTNLGWILVLGYFVLFNAVVNRFFTRIKTVFPKNI